MFILQSHVTQLEKIVSTNLDQVDNLVRQQTELSTALTVNIQEIHEPHTLGLKQQSDELLRKSNSHVQTLDTHLSALSKQLGEWHTETQKYDVEESTQLSNEYLTSQRSLLTDLKTNVEANVGVGVCGCSYQFSPSVV